MSQFVPPPPAPLIEKNESKETLDVVDYKQQGGVLKTSITNQGNNVPVTPNPPKKVSYFDVRSNSSAPR